MKMRTKFKVKSINNFENGSELTLVPVTTGSKENEEFFKWTPYGEFKVGLVKTDDAKAFAPGCEFYIDLTLAE